MASNIRVGQKLRVTVRFADFNASTGTDEPIGPLSVDGSLYKYNTTTTNYDLVGSLSPIVQDAVGVYHYDWTTPSDGRFKLVFTGLLANATPSTVTNSRVFYVGVTEPTVILTSSQEYKFLAELTPLYLDPEEILEVFPDVDLTDATEIIYRNSLLLEEWFGTSLTVTSLMREWLIAATLCELSKTYFIDGGMNGFGKSDSFTLGDLTVNNGFGGTSNSKNGIYRGNATTWCELAVVIKNEMLKSKVTYKPVVKGSAFDNPIPVRALRKFD